MNAVPESNQSICVVAVGAYTAVGATAPAAAAAVRAGIAGFSEHPYLLSRDGEPLVVARAPKIDDDPTGLERLLRLAIPAAREALAAIDPHPRERAATYLILGLPVDRPGKPAGLNEQLANGLRAKLGIAGAEVIPCGHAAGLLALEAARRRLHSGQSAFCLVGGVDSYLDADTLEWLDDCEQIHGGDNAWGFIPGEAAGFCLLALADVAQRYELSASTRVTGIASSREKNLIKTESVCLGRGLTEAFEQVLVALPSEDDKVAQVICDMNGEPYRADEYGFTLLRTGNRFIDATRFTAPADCWGDVGAASGPLFINLAVAAALRGYAPGRHTLVWTSSEGGERSALLLQSEIAPRG